MTELPPGETPPTLDELMSALAPGTPEALRARLLDRLRSTVPADEAMAGAKAFLDDNGYDWRALQDFLTVPGLPEPLRMAPIRRQRRAYAAAVLAAAAAVVGVIGWLSLPTRQELVAAAVFHEPGPPVFAGGEGEKALHEMISAYRLGDPAEGLRQLRALEATGSGDTALLAYFGGWFHYMRDDYDSAALRFQRAAGRPDSPYRLKAELMAGAAFCLGRRSDSARNLLRSIAADSVHPYRREAATLLADGRLW